MLTTKNNLDDDLDALFRLPLAEFIGARTTLAARLKKEGRTAESNQVKAIAKPSISVWTVNQLYWRHRDQFDKLISAGQRFRRAHTSRTAKASELNEALEARRDALNRLSDLAAALLSEAGHNPSLETLRRIATTLEAMSAYAALPDDQAVGRLTKDLDPPGFESLAPFIRAVPTTRQPNAPARITSSSKSVSADKKLQFPTKETRRDEDNRQARLAAARASLQNAKRSLVEARAKAQTLTAEQKKADTSVKNADKEKREAEQRFKAASTASTEAAVRAQNLTLELARAKKGVTEAEREVETAAKELESLS